jgi:4-hydroxy-2-oxoheptanedioate aldolase
VNPGPLALSELDRAQRLKRQIADGEPCLGTQLTSFDPAAAEILARAGFDWVVVDTEHSAHTTITVKGILQAMAGSGAAGLVRPLRLDARMIGRYLDIGALGVLCPFIETAEQAAELVSACRYPPAGRRGFGPRRAGGYGFDSGPYFEHANDSLVCFIIIESVRGVRNAEPILATPGIDGVIMGPMDLSIDLGAYGELDGEAYRSAIDAVWAAAKNTGKAMGMACYDAAEAARWTDAGCRLVMMGGDDVFLSSYASAAVAKWRDQTRAST